VCSSVQSPYLWIERVRFFFTFATLIKVIRAKLSTTVRLILGNKRNFTAFPPQEMNTGNRDLQVMDILSVSQTYQADTGAAAAGIPGLALMESAGAAIALAIQARWEQRDVLVLAGPGNNGGDGFVVERLLQKAGWSGTVCMVGDKAALKGNAATNAKRWRSKVQPLGQALDTIAALEDAESLLVVDALFGAGLSKPLEKAAKSLAEILNIQMSEGRAPAVVSVDTPSGVNGDTGHISKGVAFCADLTVTFCRLKPGHLLMPGRSHCGELVVADIGIADDVVASLNPHRLAQRA